MYHFEAPSDEKDVDEFYRRLDVAIELNQLTSKSLGKVKGFQIKYLEHKVERPKKRLLVAAGFHGNEIAGPWGLLRFLSDSGSKPITN